MKTEWSKISLIFLFLIALIGTLLRSVAFIPIPLDYLNLVHAHSHTAFQGWVYLIMHLFLTSTFLTEKQILKGHYPLQFKLTVTVVIGVLISFSLQGYGLYSILFSTLFQLLNYWFIIRFLNDLKKENYSDQSSLAIKFSKTGLGFGVLSTLLPYAIGIASVKGLNGTDTYNSLVYTFLHLQYNGWFLFVVLGLFFNFLDRNNIQYNKKYGVSFYWFFTVAVIPAISLSLLVMDFHNSILPIAYISAALTTVAIVYFILAIPKGLTTSIRNKGVWFRLYFLSFLASFTLKLVLQVLSVFPSFEVYAFFNKSIIIAYLHLSLIGSISLMLLALLIEKGWLVINNRVKAGSGLLLSGFATTELMLVASGLGLFHSQIILIIGSVAMCLGVLLMIISGTKKNKSYGTF